MAVPERVVALQAQNQVTGIDFVYVNTNQTTPTKATAISVSPTR